MPSSALDDLGFGDGSAPASSPASGGGGKDVSGGYHITKAPPPLPDEPDASLLARLAVAEGGKSVEGQTAVIRATLQRQALSGKPISALITEPGQMQTYWNGQLQGVDPASPAYQAALKIAQTATPSPGIDSWGSPEGIKKQGFGKMPFDPSTGTMIGGQLFGSGYAPKGGAAAPTASALDEAGFGDEGAPGAPQAAATKPAAKPLPVANVPVLDRVAADVAQAKIAQAQSGNAQWPIYDEANDVSRNKDGSLAAVRRPDGTWAYAAPLVSPSGGTGVTVGVAADPNTVLAWQRAHPLDPSNNTSDTPYGASPQTSSLGRAGVGSEQGLANVDNSLKGLDLALKGNPFTNALMTGLDPNNAVITPDMIRANLAQGVLNRNANDVTLGNSGAYNLGKFGGEVAATVPLMAATEGAGGAALDAFAPEFAGGLTAATGGNRLLQLPERLGGSMLTGARYGAEGAGLTSAGSSQPVQQQIAQGAGFGAVANPLIGAAAAPVRGLAGFIAPKLEMFSNEGKEAILNRNMTSAMEGGNAVPDLTEYVPGEPPPTWAQATHNPAMAVTERDLRAQDPVGVGNVFDAHEKAANTARTAYLTQLTGTPADVEAAEAARDSATDPMREAAFANKSPTDPTSVVQMIDNILAGPAGKSNAVKTALADVRSKLFTDTPLKIGGSAPIQQLETDPEQLYGVRKAIDQKLAATGPITDTNSDARLAQRELMQIKSALDPVIEGGAPGFQAYINTYSRLSKPANAMKYLQSLSTANSMDNMTLGKIDSALNKIERDRAKGALSGADDISDAQLQGLYNIRASLQRANTGGALVSAGRGNLVTGNLNTGGLANALTNPVAGAIAGHVAGATGIAGTAALTAGKIAFEAQKNQLQNRLVSRMLNAERTAGALDKFGVPGQPLQGNPVQNLLTRGAIAASQSNAKFAPRNPLLVQPASGPALVPAQ